MNELPEGDGWWQDMSSDEFHHTLRHLFEIYYHVRLQHEIGEDLGLAGTDEYEYDEHDYHWEQFKEQMDSETLKNVDWDKELRKLNDDTDEKGVDK